MKKICLILLLSLVACTNAPQEKGSIFQYNKTIKNNTKTVWNYHIYSPYKLSAYDIKTIGETLSSGYKKRCFNTRTTKTQIIGYGKEKISKEGQKYVYSFDIICLYDIRQRKQHPELAVVVYEEY